MENWETINIDRKVETKRREDSELRTYARTLKVKDFVYNDEWVTYEYKSTGAVYGGQWLGGMRHGEGTM